MTRILALLLFLPWFPLMAQEDGFAFVGVNNCKMCHKSKKKGNQFETWERTKHAQSLETLKSEKDLAVAKDRGLILLPRNQVNAWCATPRAGARKMVVNYYRQSLPRIQPMPGP